MGSLSPGHCRRLPQPGVGGGLARSAVSALGAAGRWPGAQRPQSGLDWPFVVTSRDDAVHNQALFKTLELRVDLNDRAALRSKLIQERLDLPGRLALADELQRVLRVWLVRRQELTIGAYWPIKGEFDPLPALYRWGEANPKRRIGLPVVDKEHGTLRFHVWYPGCAMEEDAFGIPKPKGTEVFEPQLLIVPCIGYGPCGLRLGYGGGFMDRTLAALQPRPSTAGVGYAHGFLPMLRAEPDDMPLDAVLTEEGVVWDKGD